MNKHLMDQINKITLNSGPKLCLAPLLVTNVI